MIVQKIQRQLVGRVTFPLTNALFNRRRILPMWQELLRNEWLEPRQLEALQLGRLQRQLRRAADRVPFYRDRFEAAGLVPEDVRSVSDLQAIPPLTRQDLQENLPRLIDERFCDQLEETRQQRSRREPIPLALFRSHRLVPASTSGSTGSPVILFEEGSLSALSWATELRAKKWFGVNPGSREVRLKRSLDGPSSPFKDRVRELLWNQVMLPGFNLAQADHEVNLARIEKAQPEVLWGGTYSLLALSELVSLRGSRRFQPRLVVTWSEPLTEFQRQALEEAFGCPVSNIYGSVEMGHIAATCPQGTLHAHQDYFVLETGAPYSESCPGELFVTGLIETPLPLIRYQIGDLAAVGPTACPCGRSLQQITRLAGRSKDRLITPEGRQIEPSAWPTMAAKDPNCVGVRKFQVVFLKGGGFCFRIVRGPAYSSGTEAFYRAYVERNIGPAVPVRFEFPDDIAPAPGGKYPLIVDERLPSASGSG